MGIELISASAGSGKTYSLTSTLVDAIVRKEVRPEAVLATTFTRKAAGELQERAQAALIERGLYMEAQRLFGARIGTINAVCGALVEDFAFELGLPPRLRVIDTAHAEAMLRRVLSGVKTPADHRAIQQLVNRFRIAGRDQDQIDPDRFVSELIRAARVNGIDAAGLERSGIRTRELVEQALPAPSADIDDELQGAIQAFLLASEHSTKKNTGNARARMAGVLATCQGGHLPSWDEIAGLLSAKPEVALKKDAEAVVELAAGLLATPRFRSDYLGGLALMNDLAARTLEAYADAKRSAGLIDFADQEALTLRLLRGSESARERISDTVDLMLVDEFQDTSPIQLAIFSEMSALVGRSVWVGDQKQAIYGFRGTDPALMDSAMAEIVSKGGDPKVLAHSWRSRRDLVELTSDLFAPAFDRRGIPAERVRLTVPPSHEEGADLGPIAEIWDLGLRTKADELASLAGGVVELLADETVRVRDPQSNASRRLELRDIAILCRSNADAAVVAANLTAAGQAAEIPRAALMETHEGVLVRAALKLWAEPRDGLALAELTRLCHDDASGDGWAEELVSEPTGAALGQRPEALALLATRESQPLAGPVGAFDAIHSALDLPRRVARWGDAEQRLANLEALRAMAVRFATEAQEAPAPATPAGLVAWMKAEADAGNDSQAPTPGRDAVVVSTWHGSKGLEWPIVVLHSLNRPVEPRLWGVLTEAVGAPDAADPLAGLSIRALFNPFSRARNSVPLQTLLEQAIGEVELRERAEFEELRLFYVGWTRARDRVVLAGPTTASSQKGSIFDGMPALLSNEADPSPLQMPHPELETVWGGAPRIVQCRYPSAAPRSVPDDTPARFFDPAEPRDHAPETISPSGLVGHGTALAPERIGGRVPITGSPNMAHLGEALHGYLAADADSRTLASRLELARRLLVGWDVDVFLDPAQVVRMGDGFRSWLEARWPGAVLHRELPVHRRQASGTVLSGRADLVLETAAGLVIVDHKSFPGSEDVALTRAAGYAGQLSAYAEAVSAALGRPVESMWIHLPILGKVIRVQPR